MRALVTGGTSSIGKVLVRQLVERGDAVRVLVRATSSRAEVAQRGVELVEGDVTDASSVQHAVEGCDGVFHLAAIVGSARDADDWDRVNVQGSKHVLDAARSARAGVVLVSSIAALGWTKPGEIADESHPRVAPYVMHDYGRTKNAAEDLLREHVARGLRGFTVYPGFGYGPSRAVSHPGLTDNTLLRMAAGKPMPLLWGTNRLCISYFQDTARGCIAALERGRPGEGYVLGGENLTFQEIIRGAARALGRPPPRLRVPARAVRAVIGAAQRLVPRFEVPQDFLDMMAHDWAYSSAKASRELGWTMTPFERGMRDTWRDWQARNLNPDTT